MPVDLILGRLHHLGDERADTVSDVFELGGEGEVDGHGYPGEVDGSTLVRLAFGNEAHGQPARGVSTSTATIFVSPFPHLVRVGAGDTNP